MKLTRLQIVVGLILTCVTQTLPAQHVTDNTILADIKARAERGDVRAQQIISWSQHAKENLAKLKQGMCFDEVEKLIVSPTDPDIISLMWGNARKDIVESIHPASVEFTFSFILFSLVFQNDELVSWDWEQSLPELRAKAEQGDVQAQFKLGKALASIEQRKRYGDVRDYTEAVKWYRKAAEQNHGHAQYELGNCYLEGLGVPQDGKDACKWLLLAAESGNKRAPAALNPRSLPPSYSTFEAWERSVEKGKTQAIKWLEDHRNFNELAEQQRAALREKAGKGGADAQFDFGLALSRGWLRTEDDYAEALKWFIKAAEQNHTRAQNYLGFCYHIGRGTTRDDCEAMKWYRKAAEQNYASAQFNLGQRFMNGYLTPGGIDRNEAEGIKWYRKAAEQNMPQAQFALARCYEEGLAVAKDDAESLNWCRKAAEQNHPEAQNKLGYCYGCGNGVAQDKVEAAKWIILAIKQGNTSAMNRLDDMKRQNILSPQQIAEGKQRADKWLEQWKRTSAKDNSYN